MGFWSSLEERSHKCLLYFSVHGIVFCLCEQALQPSNFFLAWGYIYKVGEDRRLCYVARSPFQDGIKTVHTMFYIGSTTILQCLCISLHADMSWLDRQKLEAWLVILNAGLVYCHIFQSKKGILASKQAQHHTKWKQWSSTIDCIRKIKGEDWLNCWRPTVTNNICCDHKKKK